MKKKLFIALGLAGLIALSVSLGVYAASPIKLFINGNAIATDVQIIKGTSYVPLKVVSESLGAVVKWDGVSRTISITSSGATETPKNVSSSSKSGNFTFENTSVKNDTFGWRITIDVTSSKDYKGASLTASFYDANGKRVGKASGTMLDIKSGELKTVDFMTMDDLTGYTTIKYQVDMTL